MKLVIFGVVAFVLGIAGSSGVMVMTAPKLPAGSDSLLAVMADSIKTHKTGGEHGAHPAPGGEHAGATQPHADSVATDPAHGAEATVAATPAPIEHVVPPTSHGLPSASATPAQQAEAYKQVGSILNNMKPVEAARILAYLSDTQVEGLLRSMGPRQSAVMLGQLPPERGAALSKRLLVPSTEGETH